VDLLHVLFGTVLGLNDDALLLVTTCASLTLVLLAIIYRLLVAECLDPGFLRASGGGGSLAHMVFLALVVLNLVAGFQVLGTLMVVGMMMLPAAAARFWVLSVASQIVLACGVAWLASYVGLLLSYHFNLPASPAIILSAGTVYLCSVVGGPHGGLFHTLRARRRSGVTLVPAPPRSFK